MSNAMLRSLQLEGLAHFILSLFLYAQLPYAWWVFPALLLLPDLSMLGYLKNPKWGAWGYNLFHHQALGIAFLLIGFWQQIDALALSGVILYGHSAMDRVFGFGLKYEDAFKHTHLA